MWKILCTSLALLLCCSAQAQAHFGVVIPSSPTVTEKKAANLHLDIAFAHPMEQEGMDMEKPKKLTVSANGKTEDLLGVIKPATLMGHKAWQAAYSIKRPGVYQFALEPTPYFEPAEDCFIIHYTKTLVAAFGEEEGWDEALGLRTEIVPLTRPFANYAGNSFQGQVLLEGKPAPNTVVEVEFFNKNKTHAAPNEYFVTQAVKTDANGIFTFTAPWAGWWGFAALNTAAEKMAYKGEDKEIELGAVLWINFAPQKKNAKK